MRRHSAQPAAETAKLAAAATEDEPLRDRERESVRERVVAL